MSEKDNVIVKYAKIYEEKLKSENHSDNEVERLLVEWIKNALEFSKKNPQITSEELENHLLGKSNILK